MNVLIDAIRTALDLIRGRGPGEGGRFEAERLRERDRARSRFFADLSHEFRTPLTLILGPLDDILGGLHGPLSTGARDQLELARRSAGRVLVLVDEILEVARLEAGRTAFRARRIDLGAFAEEVGDGYAPLAERRRLSLDVVLPAEPVVVHADPEHLEKVLSNLLSNAVKFTPEGGTVRVTIDVEPTAARISVRDSGPGIPAGELELIFERFHRAGGAAGRRPGTGIGLALARELVELHHGSLSVESEEGFGSTFTVTLPMGRAHLKPEELVADDGDAPGRKGGAFPSSNGFEEGLPPPCAERGGSEADGLGPDTEEVGPTDGDVTTVLLVEDDPEVRAYVRRHMAPAYRLLEAEDGERGLEIARRRLPDLVLSDVMMPGMDGYDLCRALKEDPETDFIPVILLTARAAAEDRLKGLGERADDYLTKPFDPRELGVRIRNLIDSRKQLRERYATIRPRPALALHPDPIEVECPDERFLERVRDTIEANLGDEDYTVARLAHDVAHSRGHLHRRLTALVDETPSALLRRMRLERAAQLLEAGMGSVGEVAYSVGFKSVSHFSNRFLDQFGVRPSAYRMASTPEPQDATGT